jgi:hypothetical protein
MSSSSGHDSSLSQTTARPVSSNGVDLRQFLGDSILQPRTFISNPAALVAEENQTQQDQPTTKFASGPVGEPVPYDPEELDKTDDEYEGRHPSHLNEAAAEAFTMDLAPSLPGLVDTGESLARASNFSQMGLVHLGPADLSPSRDRSPVSSTYQQTTMARSREQSSSPATNSLAIEREIDVVELPSTRTTSSASGSTSASDSYSMSAPSSVSEDGPHVTFRYQHLQDEDGHHLIVGREGKLTKCEDEVSSSLL